MFNQSKRNRGGRVNPGNRDKRQFNSPDSRPPRRGPLNDKNMNVDGMFKNQRITHVVITLVGTFVQVQVKNGTVYEGVLKTVSPKGDIVLEMAHKSEDSGNGSTLSSAPSRDRIIDKLILKNTDVITLNASNVDLEYAVKESFTDSGISKFNGEVKEKDLKELQPWDGEPSTNDEILDDKSENGWDPQDMFQTNATQFNVKSSYDDSLSLYTTKLEKQNTAEYKMLEERASRLAAEIEGTEQYKQNIALENGEGESEETLFSSVVRPEENRNSQMGSAGGPGKYVPPNKRHGAAPPSGNPNMTKQGRGNYSQQQQYPHPPNQQQHQQGYQQPNMGRNLHNHQQSGSAHGKHESNSNSNVNGDESARTNMPVSTAGPTVKTSPVTDHSAGSVDGKQEHNPQYSSTNKHETKKHNKGRDEKIQELKEFGSNFKLGDNKGKDKEKEKVNVSESKDSDSDEKETVSSEKVQAAENPVAPPVQSASSSPTSQEQQQQPPPPQQQQQSPVEVESKVEVEEVGSKDDITIKSNLNPNAKEFVSQKMKQPTHQAPTPPRLQTQSPIIPPAPVMNIGAAPVYPSPGQSFIMPPNPGVVLNSNQQQQLAYNARPKRAVVSVKPDPYPAASAVTGQPLLAQHNPHTPHNPHNFTMYMQPAQMMQPQPTGFNYGQMMPMPAPSNQRFVTPTSMQGPTSIQPGMDQSTPSGQPGQLYMQAPQQGPIPTHMTHGPQLNLAHFNPNNQQTTQMNSTPHTGSGHHHPAPSPVHSNPNQQQQQQQPMNPGPHPQSSGTPQPAQGYSQPTLQSHPPLQPSPHNPTSPQTMQQMPYHSHAHISMQGTAGGQQFSVPQQSSMPTPVTAHTPSQHMQPQFVMMPNVAPSAQLNHHHLHGNQFQNHITGHGSMQPQLLSQPLGHPGQNHGQAPHHHSQMQHFPLQVHSAGGQNYQPAHSSLT